MGLYGDVVDIPNAVTFGPRREDGSGDARMRPRSGFTAGGRAGSPARQRANGRMGPRSRRRLVVDAVHHVGERALFVGVLVGERDGAGVAVGDRRFGRVRSDPPNEENRGEGRVRRSAPALISCRTSQQITLPTCGAPTTRRRRDLGPMRPSARSPTGDPSRPPALNPERVSSARCRTCLDAVARTSQRSENQQRWRIDPSRARFNLDFLPTICGRLFA